MTSKRRPRGIFTVQHVGYGPSGTPAYVARNERGEYLYDERGQFLVSASKAQDLVNRHNEETS